MANRLSPAEDASYDYDQLWQELRENGVNPNIKVAVSRIDEIADVAEQLGLDPTPLRDALRVPAEPENRVFKSDSRRCQLTRTEIDRLHEFCINLTTAIKAEVDVEAIRKQIGDLDVDLDVTDHIDETRLQYESAYRLTYTISLLTAESKERDFLLKID